MNVTIKIHGPVGDGNRSRYRATITDADNPRFIAHCESPDLRTRAPDDIHHALSVLGVHIGYALACAENGETWCERTRASYERQMT